MISVYLLLDFLQVSTSFFKLLRASSRISGAMLILITSRYSLKPPFLGIAGFGKKSYLCNRNQEG